MTTKTIIHNKAGENRRFVLSVYEHEADILGVTAAMREEGIPIVDVYTPYAVHGLDTTMGLKPSKLPWVCFVLALVGAAGKTWFEFWVSAIDWPINVGGKPWDSLPAFIPITFEVMVLCAGLSTVAAFLFSRRLFPGRVAKIPYEGITDNRFVMIVEEVDAALEKNAITNLFKKFNALHIEERVEGEASA